MIQCTIHTCRKLILEVSIKFSIREYKIENKHNIDFLSGELLSHWVAFFQNILGKRIYISLKGRRFF